MSKSKYTENQLNLISFVADNPRNFTLSRKQVINKLNEFIRKYNRDPHALEFIRYCKLI